MCGIIAYKGYKNAVEIVLESLKKLEYRGYDSWGIASFSGELDVLKNVGEIGSVAFEDVKLKKSNLAVAHTRWATTGKITQNNAHPHISNDGKTAVVHNGIIDNYLEIRVNLQKKGFEFYSETDTEVISNLISYHIQQGKEFIEAFKDSIKELKGTFAIAVIHENILAFARQNSPLVIGICEGEVYIASDAAPFLDKTNKAIFMNEGDWGYHKDGELYLFTRKGKPAEVKIEEIDWKQNNKTKKGFEHYMLKEIYEQPEILANAINQTSLDLVKNELKKNLEVFLTGSGTSYNACLAAAAFFAKNKIKAIPVLASEHQNYEPFFDTNKIMIIVSQSGETADLIEVVDKAKSKGVKIIGIINVPGSTLWRKADIVLEMNAGIEIGVASTKAYMATLKLFSLLADYKINKEELSKYLKKKIKEWHKSAKELLPKIEKNLFVIGREEALSYAMETALKIKEISYIRAEGLAAGELKHGTLALIEERIPIISIATPETRQDLINNALEIKARGGYIIGIDSEKHPCYDYFIECKYPILSAIPGQLLAYELSISKGYNPDKPRNLAKSVTVK